MKGMDFSAFKNTVDCVRIFCGKLLRVCERGSFDDNQAASLISEWPGEQDFPLAIEWL